MNEESGMRNEDTTGDSPIRPEPDVTVPNGHGYKDDEERLMNISKTIKAIASMTQVGITYCLVIPGHGIREDCRLGSNAIAPPSDRSESAIMNEVNGNIVTILETYMNVIRREGYSDDAAEGLIDSIVKKAKDRFEESGAGLGKGAVPQ